VKCVTLRSVFCAFARQGHNVICASQGLLVREYYRGRYERPSDPLPP